MANKKISELPYINGSKISGNTLVPLVTYFSATTGDTVHTYISDLKNYLTSGITASGNYLPLSGGTVTGLTYFTTGLTITGDTIIIDSTGNSTAIDTSTRELVDPYSSISVDWSQRFLYDTSGSYPTVDYASVLLYDTSSTLSVDWGGRQTYDDLGVLAIDWSSGRRKLYDTSANEALDWSVRSLTKSDGTTVSFDWENGILTGQTNIQSSTISATTYQNLPPATFSGGTVTGPTTFTNGLTANTISATTYLNLPTTSSGNYLPLSGGTVTGTTYFTQGVSGNTVSATTFNFNTGYTGTTSVGQMNWNYDFGVPQVGLFGGNVTQKIGESLYAYVKNVDTSTLNKGEVVYIFGASGDKISVKRASNTGDTTSSKTIGIVAESIAVNGLGYVITQGSIDGLNLGSYTAGDIVWLATTPGQFTATKQYAPYHLVFVGVVQRANAGNGQLYVKPQNGYELEEIHDVIATGATYGDLLVYSAYGSNDVWVSTKTLKGSYTITGNTNIGGGLTATTVSATTYQNLPTDVRVTGSSYSNNVITFTNNTGGTFNVLFNTVTGLTVNGNLSVTGNTNVRAFTGTTGYISGSGQNILTVIGSGNSTTSPLFTVQGSSGELFSVNDSLTGSLFSVNDISGLPIVEVFSDNTTLWGSYQAPSLNTTTKTSLTAGTNTIYSIPTSGYTGAFYEYTLISTGSTGARAGQIMSIWSGSTANFTETTTTDIGTTTGVTFTVAVSGSNTVLSSSATTAGWTVKTIIRSI